MNVLIKKLKELKNSALQKYKVRSISRQYSDMLGATATRSKHSGPRINIVLPSIRSEATFGGVATALRFFFALEQEFPSARIIVMYDASNSFERELWSNWKIGDDEAGKSIQFLGSASSAQIPLAEGDIFIATEYRTAYMCRSLLDSTSQAGYSPRPLVYFVQDFEPLFFPWSTRYLLADSTYRSDKPTFAVFNTKLLADYFEREGYQFARHYSFEPKINSKIAKWLPTEGNTVAKRKKILIYGRPGTPRNAFEMIVLGLKEWSSIYAGSSAWEIESLGEDHEHINLTNGKQIISKGKVSLEEYAETLKAAAIGISLMVSPHPSYPPLEMASFGLGVLTNSFRNKDLSTLHGGIVSLPVVTPPRVAETLAAMCKAFESDPNYFQNAKFTDYDFLIEGDEFPFKMNLLKDLDHAGLTQERQGR